MASGNEFLLTPGPLPWRLDCMKRNPKSGAVYDADGRLVCVAAIGNAREIVRMANLFYTAPSGGAPEAQKPPCGGIDNLPQTHNTTTQGEQP